jgi:glycosyltransferase involved in cell wall biosynthesis
VKVLHVQKVKGIAGSEKFFLEMLPLVHQQGIEVSFCCIYPAADFDRVQPFIQQMEAAQIHVHALAIRGDWQVLRIVRFLSKVIRHGNFNLVHAHLIHADLWSSLCARLRFRRKWLLVSTKHGYDEGYMNRNGLDVFPKDGGKYLKIARFAEKKIDFSCALSQGLGKFYAGMGITRTPLMYIHHGYEVPAEIPAYPKKYDLVLPGRYTPLKNHDLLLQAVALLERSGKVLELVFSGYFGPADAAAMQQRIAALELRSTVQFIGHQPDILKVISQARVCVIPSKAEGFGLVVLDTFAAQTPVVVNDTPALNEIVKHNETGLIFRKNEAESLAEQIGRLLEDPELCARLSANAALELREKFNLTAALEKWLAVYAELQPAP